MSDLASAIARIDELAALEKGWLDGDGEEIRPETVVFAKEICTALYRSGAHDFSIFPTPEGNIQFEWPWKTIEIFAMEPDT